MKLINKIAENNRDNLNNPPVTIAFLGDSVTQGCFRTHTDGKAVYHNRLKEKLHFLYPNANINMINAGIAGTMADFGLQRIERDVLSKNPDLCVVCFGLNDINNLEKEMHVYTDSLEKIFQILKENNCEVIFMTPNMLNTESAEHTPEKWKEYSYTTAKWQKEGLMDTYMEAGIMTACKCDVTVCDCYSKWKRLNECGVDTNRLLSNGINHPLREMHDLFANMLLEVLLQ